MFILKSHTGLKRFLSRPSLYDTERVLRPGPKGVWSLSYVFTGPASAALRDALPTSYGFRSRVAHETLYLYINHLPLASRSVLKENTAELGSLPPNRKSLSKPGDPKRGDHYLTVAMLPPIHQPPQSKRAGSDSPKAHVAFAILFVPEGSLSNFAPPSHHLYLGESYRAAR